MISFDGVTLSVPGRTVLSDITLTLEERRVAVIGANGSGKTSFARLINGLAKPTTGTVSVDGLDASADAKEVRKRVGFLFQDPDNQIVMPLVEEDIRFSLKALKLDRAKADAAVAEILARYGLEHLREQPSHALSGGEKQLLALASVLVREPRYVVLDEPTTLLDLRNKQRMIEAIDALEQTVICVTHDLEMIRDFDRALVFEAGRVVFDGAPDPAITDYVGRAA